MGEVVLVVGVLGIFVAVGIVQAVPPDTLLELGYQVMTRAALVGVPCELVYYAALAACLHYNRGVPKGWHWRPFDHHHLLTTGQRRWVLPVFYAGALSFVIIVLGIGICVLALVGLALSLR